MFPAVPMVTVSMDCVLAIPAILEQAAKTMIHALQLTVVETEIVSMANVDAMLGILDQGAPTMIPVMALIVLETEVVLMVCVYAMLATLALVALITVQL